ncbi:MAG: hypothetical protein GF398_04005 [Chitinivibrionales bacterium]|nr:hypothetical protein [Chitinivibrionales bacterium]
MRKPVDLSKLEKLNVFKYTKASVYLKDILKKNRLSLRQLAGILDVKAPSYIYQLQKGSWGASPFFIKKFGAIFKLNQEEVMYMKLINFIEYCDATPRQKRFVTSKFK